MRLGSDAIDGMREYQSFTKSVLAPTVHCGVTRIIPNIGSTYVDRGANNTFRFIFYMFRPSVVLYYWASAQPAARTRERSTSCLVLARAAIAVSRYLGPAAMPIAVSANRARRGENL